MQTLAKEGDWPVAYNVRAGEEAKPGDVLVVDLGGGIPDGIFFGDISALAAQLQGARHAALTEAAIPHVYYESPGTDHEWQTWRRDLKDFLPRLF
jgi:enterochelin esterase-like enzyme